MVRTIGDGGGLDDRATRGFGDLDEELDVFLGSLDGPAVTVWRCPGEDSDDVGKDMLRQKEAELSGVVQDADDVRSEVAPDRRRRRPRLKGVIAADDCAHKDVDVDGDCRRHLRFKTRLTTSRASSAVRPAVAERSTP